jgi:acyl-CoA thioesterase I
MSTTLLRADARILFQGDSITDAGRNRNDAAALGAGYANLVATALQLEHPERALTVLNRGLSGNRIYDLEPRWQADCLALQPDVLSLLIGINDTWRVFDRNMPSPIPEFESCYRRLLDTVKAHTTATVLILEPFLLPVRPDLLAWREDLNPRITAIRRVAVDYSALYVPLDGLFAAAATRKPPAYWAPDGVHPSPPGHALIAEAWLQAVSE